MYKRARVNCAAAFVFDTAVAFEMLLIAPFNRIEASAREITGSAIAVIVPTNARTTIISISEKPASPKCSRVRSVRRFDIDIELSNFGASRSEAIGWWINVSGSFDYDSNEEC